MNFVFNTATIARIQKKLQGAVIVVFALIILGVAVWYGLKLWKQYNIKSPIQTLEILQQDSLGTPPPVDEQLSTLQTVQNTSKPVEQSIEEQRTGLEALQNI